MNPDVFEDHPSRLDPDGEKASPTTAVEGYGGGSDQNLFYSTHPYQSDRPRYNGANQSLYKDLAEYNSQISAKSGMEDTVMNPGKVDEALWAKAKRASEEAFGEIRWPFVSYWYEKRGGKFG